MYDRIQSMLHNQKEYSSSTHKENQQINSLQAMNVHKSKAGITMPLGIQALAGAARPVLAEVKARSLSNQLEMLERKLSYDQMLHLSTNDDSAADNQEPDDDGEQAQQQQVDTPKFFRLRAASGGLYSLPTPNPAVIHDFTLALAADNQNK